MISCKLMSLLAWISVVSATLAAEGSTFTPLFHQAVKSYGFANSEPLESGSKIVSYDDRVEVSRPNSVTNEIHMQKKVISSAETVGEPPKQWLAWYGRSFLSGGIDDHGFTSFSSDFVVPPLPAKTSNLAIFNGLQASYNPTSYNWILQPVLMHGNWMAGNLKGWGLTSVLCPNSGSCLYTKPIDTQPGNKIRGVMTLLSGSTNSYQFEVNITDITAGTPTQTLLYSSKYFAQWAFVTLEHAPEGHLTDCGQLPATPSIDFTNNILKPNSADNWQGSQTDLTCGLSVDNFVFSGDLKIKL